MFCKVLFYIEMEITRPFFGIFEISFSSAYSPIIILLNILNYVANLCLKQFIQNDFDFPFDYCNRNYIPFQRWRSTFVSSWETDSLYIAFASFSSLSCCFYERFFAIDWLFVHLCMHKINLLPCVSMALAIEGSPTIIFIKSCGGHFLWKRVWYLGWFEPQYSQR